MLPGVPPATGAPRDIHSGGADVGPDAQTRGALHATELAVETAIVTSPDSRDAEKTRSAVGSESTAENFWDKPRESVRTALARPGKRLVTASDDDALIEKSRI